VGTLDKMEDVESQFYHIEIPKNMNIECVDSLSFI
jgi:hypothetical protein